jgi:chromosome segregation ATPase
MARLTKVLVVFVTAASLGFAAFVIALINGGPNWQTLASAPALADEIEITTPSKPGEAYSAKHRGTGDALKSSRVLAEVVIDGQRRVLDDLKKEVQQLDELVSKLKPSLDESKKVIETDRLGLQARANAWSAQLARLSQALNALNAQLQTKTVEATQVQRDLEERRFEVLRLRNQLELLRDDFHAAEQQRDALIDELDLLRESQERLDRRQKQLQAQLGKGYEGR